MTLRKTKTLLKSTEDMILALDGQFKQLSHEPEKFRWLNGIRTHDLCDAAAALQPTELRSHTVEGRSICFLSKTLLYALDNEPLKTFGSGQTRIMSGHKTINCAGLRPYSTSMLALVSTPLKFAEYRNHSLYELRLWCNWAGNRTMQCIYLRCYHKSIVGNLGGGRGVKAQNSNL